ncbi:MAG: hypothetical protein PHE15_05610 [Dehalococcoidales bacterium]|nr:hypothetical protein [Dehalococcoidales bacterium]
MNCLCGKKMAMLGKTVPVQKLVGNIVIWACPPEGCGRIYLEGSGAEIKGTFYLPETNNRRIEL